MESKAAVQRLSCMDEHWRFAKHSRTKGGQCLKNVIEAALFVQDISHFACLESLVARL